VTPWGLYVFGTKRPWVRIPPPRQTCFRTCFGRSARVRISACQVVHRRVLGKSITQLPRWRVSKARSLTQKEGSLFGGQEVARAANTWPCDGDEIAAVQGFLNQEFTEPGGYLFLKSDEATSALLARLGKGALGTSEVRDVIQKLANHPGLAEALTSLDGSASISGISTRSRQSKGSNALEPDTCCRESREATVCPRKTKQAGDYPTRKPGESFSDHRHPPNPTPPTSTSKIRLTHKAIGCGRRLARRGRSK